MKFLLAAAILLVASTPAFAGGHDWQHDWLWQQDCHNDGPPSWPSFHSDRAPAPDLASGTPAILAVIGAYGAARFVAKKK